MQPSFERLRKEEGLCNPASKGFESSHCRTKKKEKRKKKMKKMTMMLISKNLRCLYRLPFLSILPEGQEEDGEEKEESFLHQEEDEGEEQQHQEHVPILLPLTFSRIFSHPPTLRSHL